MMYSNPRKLAVFDDWPCGKYQTTATFTVESHPKKGERATRTTLHPFSKQPRATKKLTYAKRVRIVDGDDGKTYILELSQSGLISVMRGTMDYQQEVIVESDPRYSALVALLYEEEAEVA